MPALAELQEDFAAAVFSLEEDNARLARHCSGRYNSQSQIQAGIAAYRRSVLVNLAGAVEATYPLLQQIVGPAFIGEAARLYALQRPSRSGDLNAYGSDFGEFLATWPPAADYPWLPAVAELEWQIQQVYATADPAPSELSALQNCAPEHWGALHFVLDPGHAVLCSPWPLARIWAVNQPDFRGDMQVNFADAQDVLIHRQGSRSDVQVLAPGQAAFLLALADGANLADAVDAATGEHPAFDLANALQSLLSSGLLRQAYLPEAP